MGKTYHGTYSTTQTLVATSFASYNPVSVANNATISVSGSSGIYGQAGGSVPAGGWTIDNEGTVKGNLYGITLNSGGTIDNGQSDTDAAKIIGVGTGIVIAGSHASVANWGTIQGINTDGILFENGGTVVNNGPGTILGGAAGIEFDPSPGTVDNEGLISGASQGILLGSGGYVTNASDGTILGNTGIGVDVTGANGTVVDDGKISAGSYSVLFSSGTNRMVVQPSAQIVGTIGGGTASGSSNTLEFANGDTVTLSGLVPAVVGTSGTFHDPLTTTPFKNFNTLEVDSGADASLTGANTLGSGTELLVYGIFNTVPGGDFFGTITLSDGTLINDTSIHGEVVGIASPSTVKDEGFGIFNTDTTTGAVSLGAGGYVYNKAGATISGYQFGIDIEGAPGTVTNLGTVTATSSTAAATGAGVWLSAGGTVNNGSNTDTGALIQAYNFGVLISGGSGVVNNDGTVRANGDSVGVLLLGGGTVTNGSTADNTALIVGENVGVGILGGNGTVTNFCTIIADNPTGGVGVVIVNGSVVNGWSLDQTASITADSIGVWAQGSAFVSNFGTIAGTDKVDSLGVYIQGRGTVVNGNFNGSFSSPSFDSKALITGNNFGVADTTGNSTVQNFGTIEARGTTGVGVDVLGNALVDNGLFTVVNSTTTIAETSALITGASAGVVSFGDLTLNNQGTILSNPGTGYGAVFGNGTIVNGASGNAHAFIKGHIGLLSAGNDTLTNWGTVSGDPAGGAGMLAGGSISLSNLGTASKVVGGSFGVDAGGSASILNEGTIAGYRYSGFSGAGIDIGGNTPGSTGIITNGSSNISTVITSALIQGPNFGIVDFGSATITNYGTIFGNAGSLEIGAGVVMGSGTIVNGASNDGAAYISGYAVGVFSPGPATITDWGTIAGGVDAISLVSGNNVVSLAGSHAAIGSKLAGPGGSIVGATAPGSTNRLEFGQGESASIYGLVPSAFTGASTGVLVTNHGSAFYATFSNFGTIQVDAGGTLVFDPADTIASGTTLVIEKGGYVDVTGTLINEGSIVVASGGTLLDGHSMVNSGTIAGDVTLTDDATLTNTSGHTITGSPVIPGSSGPAAVYVSSLDPPPHHQPTVLPVPIVTIPPAYLNFQAYITNASGGVIAGSSIGSSIGVLANSSEGLALLNSGSITGTQYGVDVAGSSSAGFGIIVNGIQFPSSGPLLVPSAVISGGQAGVYASTPFALVLNDGTITGANGPGVDLTNGGIVADAGTITGGDGIAVAFGPDHSGTLYLAPGFRLNGTVETSNPSIDKLVLGTGSFVGESNAVGTIGGIGGTTPTFNFGDVYLAASAVWSITGANTIAAGYTLSGNDSEPGILDFAPAATLDIQGVMQDQYGNLDEYGVDLNMNGPGAKELILGQNVASEYHSAGLFVAQGDTFFGTIEGVGAGDKIEIGGVSLGSNPVANYNSGNHTLVITSGNGTDYSLTDIHAPGVTHFAVSTDPNNGNVLLVADNGPSVASVLNVGTVLSDPSSIDLPLNALVTPGAPGDTETITGFSTFTGHGTVSSDGHGGLLYTPTNLASGADSFTYTVTDQNGLTATGTVDLTDLNPGSLTPFSVSGGGSINVGATNASVTIAGSSNTVAGGDGQDTVSLPAPFGNFNAITLGNGSDSVSIGGSGNTITLGNGNDTVNATGFGEVITVGSGVNSISVSSGGGNTITTGAGADVISDSNNGDTFVLNGSKAFLALTGGGSSPVFINGGNDQITGFATSTLKVGAGGGSAEIGNFSAGGGGGVVDLAGGLGFASASAIAAYANNAANSDGHGGTLLNYTGGAIDFGGVTPGHFSASNFSVA